MEIQWENTEKHKSSKEFIWFFEWKENLIFSVWKRIFPTLFFVKIEYMASENCVENVWFVENSLRKWKFQWNPQIVKWNYCAKLNEDVKFSEVNGKSSANLMKLSEIPFSNLKFSCNLINLIEFPSCRRRLMDINVSFCLLSFEKFLLRDQIKT